MQSPVLERLVGGAVLVALLLLLALIIGPREGARAPDDAWVEAPVAGGAPASAGGGATAFPGEPGANADSVSPALSGSFAGEASSVPAAPVEGSEAPSVPAAPVARNTAQNDAADTGTSPSTPAAAVPAPSGRWAVQVGSFSSRANADQLSEWCRERGYGVKVLAGQDGGRTLYRVRVGPYASRSDARSAVAELALLGREGVFLSEWEDTPP